MEIRLQQKDGVAIIKVLGELDYSNVEELQFEIQRCKEKVIEIDLQELQFMDSSGSGMLLNQARKLHEQGRILRIVRIPDHIKEGLEIIGFFKVLEVLESKSNSRE
ncbi:MAG TPA: anti-sigma factor antagonist [Peptococcaceae bacterium]|nr:MAG: Stage II sporulation protein [Clostridia bacterium 41_269]HBT20005.1 anti-sigma factor antagonist [Peptococcaceae bacterium]